MRLVQKIAPVASVKNIPRVVTCNGIAVAPDYRYYGGDATLVAYPGISWVPLSDGINLQRTGAGTPLIGQATPLPGSTDLCMTGDALSCYSDFDGLSGTRISTEDFLIILAGTVPTSTLTANYRLMFCSSDFAGGSAKGWMVYSPSAGLVRFYFEDSGTNDAFLDDSGLTPGGFYLWHFFVRRGQNDTHGMALYRDGALIAAGNPYAAHLTIASTYTLGICGTSGGYSRNNHTFCYGAVYRKAAWFAANADAGEPAAIAASHNAVMRGI